MGPSCDVWCLGCLLFELYTGRFLFQEKDWSFFFERITNDSLPILNETSLSAVGNNLFLVNLILYALNRNSEHRPNAAALLKRVNAVCRILGVDPEIVKFKQIDCYRQIVPTVDNGSFLEVSRPPITSISRPCSNDNVTSPVDPISARTNKQIDAF